VGDVALLPSLIPAFSSIHHLHLYIHLYQLVTSTPSASIIDIDIDIINSTLPV
jgi:hypothetical protein